MIRSILVIDDEADICEIAKVSLQITNQWEVITAMTGHEGVAIAISQQPDAILLDIVMPEVDGLITLRTLKETPATQSIPVIMLTATSNIITQRQYVELGAAAVVSKPFDPGILGRQIAIALNWHLEEPLR
ncbi:MAG: response regulator [Leptolyngbyaceae cyanobacterium T60_A2020_046]|nr:response regulator [Leptolyngbyaceae cyanobacterium T60_A2020_046]